MCAICVPRSPRAQDYLETLRKKEAGIFRDIIIEQEYDPFYHAEKSITYKKKGINDPLKAEAAKATREAAILPRSGKPTKKVPLGRYTLPVSDWARLDTTPYGHFAKMIDKPPAPPDKKGRMHSQVHFDHYNAPRGRSVMDKEFPKPKRTFHNTVKR